MSDRIRTNDELLRDGSLNEIAERILSIAFWDGSRPLMSSEDLVRGAMEEMFRRGVCLGEAKAKQELLSLVPEGMLQ